jgi:hypothetical protein
MMVRPIDAANNKLFTFDVNLQAKNVILLVSLLVKH